MTKYAEIAERLEQSADRLESFCMEDPHEQIALDLAVAHMFQAVTALRTADADAKRLKDAEATFAAERERCAKLEAELRLAQAYLSENS